jgi:putative hydrolase of the HAD superfamily
LPEDIANLPAAYELSGVRAVLFDAGNTLTYLDMDWIAEKLRYDGWEIDTAGLWYGQCVAAYEASRLALLKRYRTDSDRHVPYFCRVLELAGIPADYTADCARSLVEEHRAKILWRTVPPYVRETLEELARRGYVLGVVSNTDGRLKGLLDETGLAGHFRCIIDSAVVGVEKPDPAIFERALEDLGMTPSACAYVGDIYAVDIEGARRAGIRGVLLDPLHLHEEFACLRVGKLPDILPLLPRIGDSPNLVAV